MQTDEMDLLRGIAPPADRLPLYTEEQREALFSATVAGSSRHPAGMSRPRGRTRAIRLAPIAAATAAASVAVAVATGMTGTTGPVARGPAAHDHPAAYPQVRTVAEIRQHTLSALAALSHGTLRVNASGRYGIDSMIQNLASGATKETMRSVSGKIVAVDSTTGSGPAATATYVDYSLRAWWTEPGGFGNQGRVLTAVPTLRQQLAAGALSLVGHTTVAGQPAIHLRYRTGSFTVRGKKYYVSMTDVWVSARSFLPLRYSGRGSVTELSWSSRPPAAAQITAIAPAGFRHLPGPPSSLEQPGGGPGSRG